MIRPEYVQRIKDRTDIVDVIQAFHIPLKKAGSKYLGCCPFHNEKSPSFNVDPVKQIYKCFGCGVAGDALEFVQKFKNLDFPEAVEFLAGRLNDTVEYESSTRPKSRFFGKRL